MIDYQTFHQIHALSKEGLNISQIARQLQVHPQTVSEWLKQERYRPRTQGVRRTGKLEPFKASIVRWMQNGPLSAQQILRRLREQGYTGGRTILCDYMSTVRPRAQAAFLTLHFEPGECAQVDWGSAGSVSVGNTRRKLSFFVMVLCHSRMLYVEFTLSQTQEQFLSCHERALEYFGGVPRKVMLDNLKSAVLSHPRGQPVQYHPVYLDFARHYGFEVRACNVRAAHEKGRVENAVRYVRSSFLNAVSTEQFAPINPAVREWLDTVANVRVHAGTRQRPVDRFVAERAALRPLPAAGYECCALRPVSASHQFRVVWETNRYSVPWQYASRRLLLKVYPRELLIYEGQTLIARHARCYDRHQDILQPDHQSQLLQQRRKAREQGLLRQLLALSPRAEQYVQQLEQTRLNAMVHIRKIVALSELYGADAVGRAIEDAIEYQAFSSDYIQNILLLRDRQLPQPGALHLTRRADLLEMQLPEPDLSVY